MSSQLDRQSRYRPAVATIVPLPFRFFAQASIVQQRLERRSDPKITYHEARRLLLRRPVAADNLTLFGLAAIQVGDTARSFEAFSLAASRGWHGDIPQYIALVAAAQAGRWHDASLRLRALLQSRARDKTIAQAITPFMKSMAGRTALATVAADNPAHVYQLLSLASSTTPPTEFQAFIAQLSKRRKNVACPTVHKLVSRWLDRGISRFATLTWDSLCGSPKLGHRTSLAFTSATYGSSPFAWELRTHPKLDVHMDVADGALNYSNHATTAHVLAVRRLVLDPGLHIFKIMGRSVDGGGFPGLRLHCTGLGPSIRLAAISGNQAERGAVIPPTCAVQKLEVIVPRGSFSGFHLQLATP